MGLSWSWRRLFCGSCRLLVMIIASAPLKNGRNDYVFNIVATQTEYVTERLQFRIVSCDI